MAESTLLTIAENLYQYIDRRAKIIGSSVEQGYATAYARKIIILDASVVMTERHIIISLYTLHGTYDFHVPEDQSFASPWSGQGAYRPNSRSIPPTRFNSLSLEVL